MKTEFILAFMLNLPCVAQTNTVKLTVPAGTYIDNAYQVHFDGTPKPETLIFQTRPAVRIELRDYLYDPSKFWFEPMNDGTGNFRISFKWQTTLNVYELSAVTNYDALGNMRAVDAVFDFRPVPVHIASSHGSQENRNAASALRVPVDVYEKAADQAERDWPDNISRQEYEVKKTCQAWRKLHGAASP